jgi:hypothetical protein
MASFAQLHLLPLLQICEQVDISSLLALALTCKRFANIVHSDEHACVWHCRFSSASAFALLTHFRVSLQQLQLLHRPLLTFSELFALERIVLANNSFALTRSTAETSSIAAWRNHLRLNVAVPLALADPPPTLCVALLGAPALTVLALSAALALRSLLDSFPRIAIATNAESTQTFALTPTSQLPVCVCARKFSFARLVDATRLDATDLLLFVASGDAREDTLLVRELLAWDKRPSCRVAVFVSSQTPVEPFKPLMLRASIPTSPPAKSSSSSSSAAATTMQDRPILVLRSLERALQSFEESQF